MLVNPPCHPGRLRVAVPRQRQMRRPTCAIAYCPRRRADPARWPKLTGSARRHSCHRCPNRGSAGRHGKGRAPRLVDSHTHLIFAAPARTSSNVVCKARAIKRSRPAAGHQRHRALRSPSVEGELKALARPRLARMLAAGRHHRRGEKRLWPDPLDELKALEAIADLNDEGPLELVPTFLGAHAVPPEFATDRAGYVRLLTETMLPEVARCGLADFCDVFCETGVFGLEEARLIWMPLLWAMASD